jgi:hypothetical protein
MPIFLINIIVNLVLKFGIPYLIEWLKKRWGISVTPDQVEQIVLEHNENKRRAKRQLKAYCTGTACPSDVK